MIQFRLIEDHLFVFSVFCQDPVKLGIIYDTVLPISPHKYGRMVFTIDAIIRRRDYTQKVCGPGPKAHVITLLLFIVFYIEGGLCQEVQRLI
jgi:hypothetical protein